VESVTSDLSAESAEPGAGPTDAQLWDEVLQGSEHAWELLVRRYEALVYTVATRCGLSLADAADCFQQTWLQLYTHRKSIREAHRICAWLTTTAKREALRTRRRDSREADPAELLSLADPRPLADADLAALEQRAHLEAALDRLDTRCGRLLRILFFDPEAPSYDEIAAATGIAKNSMGPVRSRCLAKLKALLEAEGWT
jgi:RNA polymerase sigma factor (sigma-70 family)